MRVEECGLQRGQTHPLSGRQLGEPIFHQRLPFPRNHRQQVQESHLPVVRSRRVARAPWSRPRFRIADFPCPLDPSHYCQLYLQQFRQRRRLGRLQLLRVAQQLLILQPIDAA